jgi:hypothetical protein
MAENNPLSGLSGHLSPNRKGREKKAAMTNKKNLGNHRNSSPNPTLILTPQTVYGVSAAPSMGV